MFIRNEFRCLTNIVTQVCVKNQVVATWGILPLVREALMVGTPAEVKPEHVRQIMLHQCPQGDGRVRFTLEVTEADEHNITTHVRHLEGPDGSVKRHPRSWLKPKSTYPVGWLKSKTPPAQHADLCLYHQDRDGAVEYLHLKH